MATVRMANGDAIDVEQGIDEVASHITKAQKANRPIIFLKAASSAGGGAIYLNHAQISSIK